MGHMARVAPVRTLAKTVVLAAMAAVIGAIVSTGTWRPGAEAASGAEARVLGATQRAVGERTGDGVVAAKSRPASPTTERNETPSSAGASAPVTPTSSAASDAAGAELDATASEPGSKPSAGSVSLGPASVERPAPTTTAAVTTAPPASPNVAPVGGIPATDDNSADALLAELGIDFDTMLPGWTLNLKGPRTGMRGSTFPYEHRIDIYVRDSFSRVELLHVISHEIGHALDVTYLDDTDRDRWTAARGVYGLRWWTGSGATDFAVGSGDFAESYAWSRLGSGPWYSEIGGPPSAEQLALLQELVG